jgi:hypothetical protein
VISSSGPYVAVIAPYFREVTGCGTGIMLIKPRAIATMRKTPPGISDTETPVPTNQFRLFSLHSRIK